MATSVVSPSSGGTISGPSASSADFDSVFSSTLNEAFDAATSDETPGGEAGGSAEAVPATEPAPGGEAPASPQEAAPQEPFPLSLDGNSYLVPKADFPAFQTARQFHEAVSAIFPNVDIARNAAGEAHSMRLMQNDWLLGNPDGVQAIMKHWAGMNETDPGIRFRAQQSFGKLSQALPGFLRRSNPQAYEGMVSQVKSSIIEDAWSRAAQTGDPKDIQEAQSVEWGLTGDYRKDVPKVDPATIAQRQFEQQRQEFEQRQTVAMNRDLQNFNQSAVEGGEFQVLQQRIQKVLEPYKDRLDSQTFNEKLSAIHRDLLEKLKSSEPEWFLEHTGSWQLLMDDYRQTWWNGSPGAGLKPRVDYFVNDGVSHAMKYLPSIAKARLSGVPQRPGPKPGMRAAPGGTPPNGTPAPSANGSQNSAPGRVSASEWDKQWNQLWNS